MSQVSPPYFDPGFDLQLHKSAVDG